MLPLALKVVWLVLALLGVPATWLVFIPFASTIGTYWASVLYCVTVTVLEGIIWRMSPSDMPLGFCVAQTVIIALCFHVLTGVCGCFTWASYLTVLSRTVLYKHQHRILSSALLWRRAYYLFVIVFPVLAFTAHLTAVLKTHSVQPMNDLHCDNTSPLWPRLLGYAGAPIVLFTPCFIISILTAVRVLEMRARLRAFRSQDTSQCRAGNNGPHIAMPMQPVASPMIDVSDKHPPRTLDGQKGMRVDVQLDRTMTQCSSRVSLPLTMSSNTHTPIEPPALSPLVIPSAHPSQLSPTPSNDSTLFRAIDRSKTPSPIMFASTSISSSRRHQGGAGESSSNGHVSSAHDPGMPNPNYSDDRPTSPVSPSRVPISLESGERMPGFHLPTRSPPTSLRPSLELSPDYVRARLEESCCR
ncbi:hypothetical protein BJV78DRAFT_1305335 [Lactifluus subvellereus]|nr:hypothetical protein BJV78DRAFT_1305335 [Lactifluus subvellereus]